MYEKLDSLQSIYKVIEREFEKVLKEKVDKAFKQFERLRGTPIE